MMLINNNNLSVLNFYLIKQEIRKSELYKNITTGRFFYERGNTAMG